MLTVIETPLFQKQWPHYWTEEERGVFAAYISVHPNAGDVVPDSGGLRKVRWGRAGTGNQVVSVSSTSPVQNRVN